MNTRIAYSGPITLGIPYEVRCKSSTFIQIDSAAAFTATLYHLKVKSGNQNYTIADFKQLNPVVTFTEGFDYRQTLGGGNYAIVFTAALADASISFTQ